MSVDATRIYCDHPHDHDLSEAELIGPDCVLDGRNVTLTRSVDASKKLNDFMGPAMIISSSGMMEGGRILHHLKRRLAEANNTVLLGGYMAAGTRGRMLEDGAKFLRIHGRDVPVRAAIEKISGLSGHADRTELLRWLDPLPAPQRTFITHGELDSANALAVTLRERWNTEVIVPKLGQGFDLG
jgi:metallo-beta-lactamase family protein